jgi:hypothetical protein
MINFTRSFTVMASMVFLMSVTQTLFAQNAEAPSKTLKFVDPNLAKKFDEKYGDFKNAVKGATQCKIHCANAEENIRKSVLPEDHKAAWEKFFEAKADYEGKQFIVGLLAKQLEVIHAQDMNISKASVEKAGTNKTRAAKITEYKYTNGIPIIIDGKPVVLPDDSFIPEDLRGK